MFELAWENHVSTVSDDAVEVVSYALSVRGFA